MMSFHDRMKIVKRLFARYGMFGSYYLVNALPYSVMQGVTRLFIPIGFFFTKHLQKVARETLTTALGKEKSEAEISVILKNCFSNFAKGMMEMLYVMGHPEIVKPRVDIVGKEHLERAIQAGNGVVAVTAHFGNFPMMMVRLAQEGYVPNVIMRVTRDKAIDEFLFKARTGAGIKTIYTLPRKNCVHNTLKALRQNEIVFILNDQNFGSDGGVFVDFFGQKAATATGPVIFAQRSQAPILPMFIVTEPNDRYRIMIEPPLELENHDDEQEMLRINVAKLTKIIETYIRKYPHEWAWMHHRWKTQQPQAQMASGEIETGLDQKQP